MHAIPHSHCKNVIETQTNDNIIHAPPCMLLHNMVWPTFNHGGGQLMPYLPFSRVVACDFNYCKPMAMAFSKLELVCWFYPKRRRTLVSGGGRSE